MDWSRRMDSGMLWVFFFLYCSVWGARLQEWGNAAMMQRWHVDGGDGSEWCSSGMI